MNFMNADANWTVMIQRKDKPGKFGIKLDLEEIAPKEMKQLKAEAGNRFRMWFIGKDQKLLPGTRDIKMNIGRRGFPDEITSVRIELEGRASTWQGRWPLLFVRGWRGEMGNNFTLGRPKGT